MDEGQNYCLKVLTGTNVTVLLDAKAAARTGAPCWTRGLVACGEGEGILRRIGEHLILFLRKLQHTATLSSRLTVTSFEPFGTKPTGSGGARGCGVHEGVVPMARPRTAPQHLDPVCDAAGDHPPGPPSVGSPACTVAHPNGHQPGAIHRHAHIHDPALSAAIIRQGVPEGNHPRAAG